MKLISEEVQNAEYLVEETNGKKSYKIRGIFLQSNMKNRNGRVYPKEILEQEVSRYNKEFIDPALDAILKEQLELNFNK